LVTQIVEAEVHDLHGRYLSRRERLLDAALAAERAVSRARVSVLPAAGLLAVSSALLLVSRRIAGRVM
jgi:hypothetical protein